MEVSAKYNYYDILEVDAKCPQHEITSAYEKMKSTYSGENAAIYTIFSEQEAREMCELIEEAYSVLGNKTLRLLYDEKLGKGVTAKSDLNVHSLTTESRKPIQDFSKKSSLQKPQYPINEKIEAEIKTKADWSGEDIKKIREYKNWTVEAIADYTKITAFYIKGIEKMDPKSLPAIVFVRGYVSQLCKVLGLNEKTVCDSYMKKYKQVLENN